jgi:hypothetical protein
MDLRETDWRVCVGFDWLRIGSGGGLLWVRWWTFGFLRHGVSYAPEFRSRKSFPEGRKSERRPGNPLPGTGITNSSLVRPNFGSLCVPEPIFFKKYHWEPPMLQNCMQSNCSLHQGGFISCQFRSLLTIISALQLGDDELATARNAWRNS